MKKKLLSALFALTLAAGLSAFDSADSRIFVDSVGREVSVPQQITKVAVSGPLSQIALFPLCPDKLAGVSSKWDASSIDYLDEKYYNLPVLGQLYGGKGELNLESLLNSGAEIVIDIGEPKKSIKEDLDNLQEQTGLPFVHITATTDTMGEAYRMLGSLLNMEEEAEVIASYCDDNLALFRELTNNVEKKKILYLLGSNGQNVIARGAYHAEVIDLVGDNVAVLENPSSKGTGNETDLEQILLWNPDYIFFAPDSIYDTVAEDETWKQITAIQEGHYYKVPYGPYNWMGFPPSVQRYLGMFWMTKILYPEVADYDLQEKVTEYFKLFYHCDLSEEQYLKLIGNSIA